tara:strand:+ start:16903 stop:17286 length:384 start_codon:yes stop_codon:yes gene_type:complete
MKIYLLIFLLTALALLTNTACDTTGTKDEPEYLEFPLPVNEKISKLYDCCDEPDRVGYRNYHFAEWYPGEVYTTTQMRKLTLEPSISIPFVVDEELIEGDVMYMTKAKQKTGYILFEQNFIKNQRVG